MVTVENTDKTIHNLVVKREFYLKRGTKKIKNYGQKEII